MNYETVHIWLVTAGEFIRTTVLAAAMSVGLVPAPCSQPLPYHVGQIDERFHISKEEAASALTEAEGVWEKATGRDLLQQEDDAGLPVNFVYDNRQQVTDAKRALEGELATLGVEKSGATTDAKVATYKAALKEYQLAVSAYQSDVNDLNNKITKINQDGGASTDDKKRLQKEVDALRSRYNALEAQREAVNALGDKTQQLISQSNQLIDTYNQKITNFQKEYGNNEEAFDQGVYTGDTIMIYQYDDREHLVLVLAHELGHALGIEHVEDTKALMYYLLNDQDSSHLGLAEADKAALAQVCARPKFPWQE